MAKTGGLGDNLYVAGYNLSGDTGSLSKIGGGFAPLDVTGIDKSAHERIAGVRDGNIEFTSFFNPSPGRAHPVLSVLPTSDVILTYCRGTTLGNPAACLVGKQINYAPTRATGGALTIAVHAQANGYGIEWGNQLTAGQRTDTTATNGTGVDYGTGSTTFGLQAYAHVFSFTGTSVTIKLQHSTDDAATDPYTDITGAGFTAATAITSQRIATADNLTIKRYVRAVTTGTFSNAVFAVAAIRNDTAVVF